MKNYSKVLQNQGQTSPALGHNMVQNNAGGFSFEISDQERLERFLLIGSEGGTYYASEQKLTEENAHQIVKMIKENGQQVVDTVVRFSKENRAPKADAGLFVLALATKFGSKETKAMAYSAISKVCKTSTHLFTFLANIKNLRGWSRGLRNGVANFYRSKTNEQIAYQMVKYRNRAGYTHRDALRLSHAKPVDSTMSSLFNYAVGKQTGSSNNKLISAFESAQNSTDVNELVSLIKEYNLTWEMVPTEFLNDKEVLTALLDKMPLTALMRNLNRFAKAELTIGNTEVTQTIVDKLTNKEEIKKSGIHPVNVVNSMLTYSSGSGFKGSGTWKPNQNIVDAMCETYELALGNVESTGKRILIGVDVSGSMSTKVGGTAMSCAQMANVLALTMLKTEPNAELICFDTNLVETKIGRRTSLDEAINKTPQGGGTDCAVPLLYALQNKRLYDSIVILTDSETWAGKQHAVTALEFYRRKVPGVKVVEVALESNSYSSMPNNDKNVLRCVGFDSALIEVVNNFIK